MDQSAWEIWQKGGGSHTLGVNKATTNKTVSDMCVWHAVETDREAT